ncbi:MAG TPA: disulfide bond formation protein DsbA, partial [Sphingobium sp.]|nr:disulfide bond formation protein DsbA [Sphingobium sp.]
MTDQNRPSFRAALSNRTIQMTLGAFAFIAAAAGAALAVQAPASVGATDKAAIEQIVHDYILEHPEIIPQAIEKLQSKRLSSVIDASRSALETPYAGAWEGAADADVTVVEFFDYACGYCRASL